MPRAAPPPARSTAAWWRERRAGTGLRRSRILARSAGSAGRRALRTADTARRRQGDSCRLALRARPERNGAGGQQCAGREQRAGQAASGAQDVADADERDDLSDREGGRQRADEAACRRTAHDARLLEAGHRDDGEHRADQERAGHDRPDPGGNDRQDDADSEDAWPMLHNRRLSMERVMAAAMNVETAAATP